MGSGGETAGVSGRGGLWGRREGHQMEAPVQPGSLGTSGRQEAKPHACPGSRPLHGDLAVAREGTVVRGAKGEEQFTRVALCGEMAGSPEAQEGSTAPPPRAELVSTAHASPWAAGPRRRGGPRTQSASVGSGLQH